MDKSTKNLLLGISGGIAAYKTPHLVRLLTKTGYDVEVCLTTNAENFVAPLSLQAVSGRPVLQHQFSPLDADGMDHISHARWADCLLIAPASASLIARLAHGICDDLLTTLALASDCQKILAPAMNQTMWLSPIVQNNITQLQSYGWNILPVDSGEQACGESGPGRMLQPEQIVELLETTTPQQTAWWQGKKLLITAGPTHEAIDKVRYVGNRSSGKFGYALAIAAHQQGAEVTIISGPSYLQAPCGIHCHKVKSAEEMLQAVQQYQDWDVFIGCAAVADYTPVETFNDKRHKSSDNWQLTLKPTVDIISNVSRNKKADQIIIGFCAETQDLIKRAKGKLITKNLDMVIANNVDNNLVFDQDEAEVWIVNNTGELHLPTATKQQQARKILDAISGNNQQ